MKGAAAGSEEAITWGRGRKRRQNESSYFMILAKLKLRETFLCYEMRNKVGNREKHPSLGFSLKIFLLSFLSREGEGKRTGPKNVVSVVVSRHARSSSSSSSSLSESSSIEPDSEIIFPCAAQLRKVRSGNCCWPGWLAAAEIFLVAPFSARDVDWIIKIIIRSDFLPDFF